jgi:hypothetical protein
MIRDVFDSDTVCDHLQSYEQAFEQIKEATGITDIDQLVTKFIEGTSMQ